MKFCFCILITTFWITKIFAQEVSKTIKTSQFTESSSIAVQDNFIYLNKSHNFYFGYQHNEEWLLKLDNELRTVDSVNLSSIIGFNGGNNKDIRCDKIVFLEKNILSVLVNSLYYITDSNGITHPHNKGYLLEFDENLNLLNNIHLDVDSLSPRFLTIKKYGTGKLIGGNAYMQQGFRPLLLKINSSGNILFTRLYNKSGNGFDGSLRSIIPARNSRYLLGIEDQSNSPAGSEILVVDSVFHIKDTIPMYYTAPFYPRFRSFELTKDDIGRERVIGYHIEYLDTIPNPIRYHMQLGIAEIDSNFELKNIRKYPLSDFEATHGQGTVFGLKFISQNTDFSNSDSILLVATGHSVGLTNDYVDQWPNPLYIYNYNLNSDTLNWMKLFDNGYVHNSFTLARRLPGNRYLVGRNEYNWDKYPGYNLAIVLMILNEKGDLISQREIPVQRAAFSVYPNPFENELRIYEVDYNKEYEYKLWNLSGLLLESGSVENGKIKFEDNFTGTFILELFSGKKLIGVQMVKGM